MNRVLQTAHLWAVTHDESATDDIHPVHLRRHGFELTSVAGAPAAGVIRMSP